MITCNSAKLYMYIIYVLIVNVQSDKSDNFDYMYVVSQTFLILSILK